MIFRVWAVNRVQIRYSRVQIRYNRVQSNNKKVHKNPVLPLYGQNLIKVNFPSWLWVPVEGLWTRLRGMWQSASPTATDVQIYIDLFRASSDIKVWTTRWHCTQQHMYCCIRGQPRVVLSQSGDKMCTGSEAVPDSNRWARGWTRLSYVSLSGEHLSYMQLA